MKHLAKLINLLPYLLISILGIYALNFSMALQPWAKSDTALYYNMAQNIAAGNGFVTNYPSGRLAFVGLHPPFLSVIWSIFVQLQIPLVITVKITNSFFLATILLSSGLWMQKLTKKWWSGILLSLFLLANPRFYTNFRNAMSEPLFLFLALPSLFLLVEGLIHPRSSVGWLVCSAVLAGLAAFTRFIGIASIFLGCAAILLFLLVSRSKKWLLACAYGIIAIIPLLYWFILKWFVFPADTSRAFEIPQNFYRLCAQFFFGVADTVIQWIPPAMWISDARVRRWLTLAVLALLTGIMIGIFHKQYKKLYQERDAGILTAFVALLLCISFLIVFFLSYVFTSISPDINHRTLVMLIPALLIAAIAGLSSSLKGITDRRKYFPSVLIGTLLVVFLPLYALDTLKMIGEQHRNEEGYLQPKYVNSEFMQAIIALPNTSKLISNQSALILLHTSKYPYEFQDFTCDNITARAEIPFGESTSENDQRYRDGMLLAVLDEDLDRFFQECFSNDYAARKATFLNASTPVKVTADGTLYRYDSTVNTK